jgi:hypothetical protein
MKRLKIVFLITILSISKVSIAQSFERVDFVRILSVDTISLKYYYKYEVKPIGVFKSSYFIISKKGGCASDEKIIVKKKYRVKSTIVGSYVAEVVDGDSILRIDKNCNWRYYISNNIVGNCYIANP